MKKYFILTSLLSLTACFGGGGNGVTSGTTTSGPRAATVLGAANSNTEITNMASAVIVKNDGSYVDTARAAKKTPDTTTFAGYTVYKLDNIDFKLIGDKGSSTFNFGIDSNGRIASATANGQTIGRDTTTGYTDRFYGKTFQLIDSDHGDTEQRVLLRTASMTQDDLNNARDEYLATKISGFATLSDEAKNTARAKISWNYLEQSWKFDSDGDDAGLTYSDFGRFTSTNVSKLTNAYIDSNGGVKGTDNGSNHESNMLFSGGYAINGTTLKETLTPDAGATYTGKATGVVTASIKCTGGDCSGRTTHLNDYNVPKDNGNTWTENAGLDSTLLLTTNKATLKIDTEGTQKLTMPFNTKSAGNNVFYDVEITMNKDGNIVAFKDDNPGGTSMSDNMYRVDSGTTPTTAITSGFYGVNSADEATGAVRYYAEKNLDENTKREFELQGAWGLKKD